ncbi:uncharacterized protein BXZ73DRAFT_101606 [Epithele typhae]|uniref:uncharacterized protein n=1 Tax=Epithele typhae TaxID=378194 RepID=UPI00200879B5|nr:uncharacterized protein BXZ73DRAFT_101606 [Epithele typhae]KAH9931697.1 hypothetical protein BXZ73DRAFT_101606 [Epithele typhae]
MATPPPSQFAALLRRSKFASFDPLIGQVYTPSTAMQHAAIWTEAPLALRTRHASITVNAVDRDCHTDWNRAEKESRWIRMWDEMDSTPAYSKKDRDGQWREKAGLRTSGKDIPWLIDSEFNLEAMTHEQFEKYLASMRRLRPQFRAFLAKRHQARGTDDAPLFRQSFRIGDEFRAFLQERARQKLHSFALQPQPHRFAGLSYAHTPGLQNMATSKAIPGRVNGPDSRSGHLVSVAGTIARLAKGDRRSSTDASALTYRLAKSALIAAPEVVGKEKEGLDAAEMDISAFEFDMNERGRNFAGMKPGSRAYVGLRPVSAAPVNSMTRSRVRQPVNPTPTRDGRMLLDTLNSLAHM